MKKKAAKKVPAKKRAPDRPRDEYGLNENERRFVENLAKGLGNTDAYAGAGFRSRSRKAMAVAANRLLKRDDVQKAYAAEVSKNREIAQVEKSEIIGFLLQVMRTGAGKVDAGDSLCQEFQETEVSGEVLTRRVKMPDKIRAVDRLCAMLGFNQPEEVKVAADDALTNLLLKIRTGG